MVGQRHQQNALQRKIYGDALLQKTYTVDFLTKKKVINRDIILQYYIKDDHDAIIPKELFYRVQEEKARRANIYRPVTKKRIIRSRENTAPNMYCRTSYSAQNAVSHIPGKSGQSTA